MTDRSADAVQVTDSTGSIAVESWAELAGVRTGDAVELQVTKSADGFVGTSARVWPMTATLPQNVASGDSPYSYLRFRSGEAVELLRTADRAVTVARSYLTDHYFVEANTPQLWRASREYGESELRVTDPADPESGSWLLQSPTLPAMLCAIGGVDRAFQFSRCFRAEPSASPLKAYEFTQLNLAVTFTCVEEQMRLLEGLFEAVNSALGLPSWGRGPFPVLDYDACLRRFGSDTPDYRYGAFPTPVLDGGPFGRPGQRIRALIVPRCTADIAHALRSMADRHLGTETVFQYNSDGAVTLGDVIPGLPLSAPVALVGCAEGERAEAFVRKLAQALYPLITGEQPPAFGPLWIRRQPFLSEEEHEARSHHSKCLFGQRLGPAGELSDSYDLVVNGVELLSGSQNEVEPGQLLKNFAHAGVSDPEEMYGYYLEALRFGAPPLHNTSIGWERFVALLLGVPMRDVMIMPKTGSGQCAVTGLPAKS
ncbi:amino acid--tRNA ligase-related protein [Nonomuraea sp. NPDC051941]|uniref:amino acid--tRNA ligase-related protein n=1 Tax=Nonomuraea sp. NPDC051941 TaxID=3364373 RepID=UPI0037C9C6F9